MMTRRMRRFGWGASARAAVLLAIAPRTSIADDPPKPAEALEAFQVADDLAPDRVLAEPRIAQPLFLDFDERGRLWVVEDRQYPDPAGLTVPKTPGEFGKGCGRKASVKRSTMPGFEHADNR